MGEYPHNNNNNNDDNKNESSEKNIDFNTAEIFWKSQTVKRGKQTIYGNAWPKDYSAVAGCKNRILELFAEKKLISIVDDTHEFVGLESVSDAIDHMLSGKTIGKVVVKIQ